MIKPVRIENSLVGPENPCFIIAEAGVNHNGDPDLAYHLIDAAAEAGADAVKFQTYKTERIVTPHSPKAAYQLHTTDSQESQIVMLKKLELPLADYRKLISLCLKREILFLSTPYDIEDADFLDELGVPAFKVASGQAVEPHFLKHLAKKRKPIFLSTGMCSLAEVDEAVRAIREEGNDRIIVLQCTTNYPSRLEDCNLRAMLTMGTALNVITGYSDHTQGLTAAIGAVALGARVIEKHFTLDKNMIGPDHSSSSDPEEFKRLVECIRETELCLGSNIKRPTPIEQQNSLGMRRSVVAKQFITAGTPLSWTNITLKRPGTGLSGRQAELLLGKKARFDIAQDSLISLSMIE